MPRITPIDPEHAEGKAKTLLDGIQKSLGKTPNLLRTMARSPAVLEAYLGFNRALGGGSLGPELREQIAIAVSSVNGCTYCVAAHTAIGRSAGVADEELAASLHGLSADPKTAAALEFARRVVSERGRVTDDDLARVRGAGYGDGDIIEIIGTVIGATFTNYFNHIAQTEVDFPPVAIPEAAQTVSG